MFVKNEIKILTFYRHSDKNKFSRQLPPENSRQLKVMVA